MSEQALTTTERGALSALDQDLHHVAEILRENMGPGGITQYNLSQIRVPSGGGLQFTVEDADGEKQQNTIKCVVVLADYNRGFWELSMDEGGGGAPDCTSRDGITGIGNPGGSCHTCPKAQWGSGKNGSKACGEKFMLFILRGDCVLPDVLQIPASSMNNWRMFALKFGGTGRQSYEFLTEIGLKRATSKSGIKYSQVTFRKLPDSDFKMEPEDIAKLAAYREEFSRLIGASAGRAATRAPRGSGAAVPPPPAFD